MKIVFRCDASIQMGTGHVMRCLTLADALAEQGAECHFICREHAGHLLDMIHQRGHKTYGLPLESESQLPDKSSPDLAHSNWLGATQQRDAELCRVVLDELKPDWLVVDHYALDVRWEKLLRPHSKKLMVIDDLADRQHDCDILLDQTFGRDSHDYLQWTPGHCQLLCGSSYALLRPEFAQWREYSLSRREKGQLEHLLVNLGGVDKDNVTIQILKALATSSLPEYCKITVVMGATAPWTRAVQEQAALMPWPTEIKVGVSNMAELMANSDLAIGAAGSTTWERFCMGLPSILVVLSRNQECNLSKILPYQLGVLRKDDNNFVSDICMVIKKIKKNDKVLVENKKLFHNYINGNGVIKVSNIIFNR